MTQAIVNTTSGFDFEYNSSMTHQENFLEWFELNRDERQAFGEEVLSREDALVLFSNMYPKNG